MGACLRDGKRTLPGPLKTLHTLHNQVGEQIRRAQTFGPTGKDERFCTDLS